MVVVTTKKSAEHKLNPSKFNHNNVKEILFCVFLNSVIVLLHSFLCPTYYEILYKQNIYIHWLNSLTIHKYRSWVENKNILKHLKLNVKMNLFERLSWTQVKNLIKYYEWYSTSTMEFSSWDDVSSNMDNNFVKVPHFCIAKEYTSYS
jgi:hypothetical protein